VRSEGAHGIGHLVEECHRYGDHCVVTSWGRSGGRSGLSSGGYLGACLGWLPRGWFESGACELALKLGDVREVGIIAIVHLVFIASGSGIRATKTISMTLVRTSARATNKLIESADRAMRLVF
jgi:hypothetical protein